MIFNAGSNYPSKGGSYGSLQVSGTGATVTLTPPSSGTYAGIVYFESRDNTTAVTVGGSGVVSSPGGVVYVPAAQVRLSGNAMFETTILVNDLSMSGQSDPSSLPYAALLQEIASRRAAPVDPDGSYLAQALAAREPTLEDAGPPAMTPRERAGAARPDHRMDEQETPTPGASQANVATRQARGKGSAASILDKLFADLGQLDNLWCQ
jgi:hypothetical protein